MKTEINSELVCLLGPIDDNTIETIDLEGKTLKDQDIQILALHLGKNTSVMEVNLARNQIGPHAARWIANHLILENKTIETLQLWNNKLCSDGARIIAKAMIKNTSIKALHLGWNSIGDAGASWIARMLNQNCTLEELNIRNNDIQIWGGEILASALEANTTLQLIHLDDNRVGTKGAYAISQALEKNNSIDEVYLRLNRVGGMDKWVIKNRWKNSFAFRPEKIKKNGMCIFAVLTKNKLRKKKRLLRDIYNTFTLTKFKRNVKI